MTLSRTWLTVACLAAALGGAGCGGGDDEEDTGAVPPAATEAAPPAGTDTGATDTASAGKDSFAASCGGCHTLEAAGTSGQAGPNLDELKPDADRVLTAIKEGPSIMPANLIEGDEAQQVAEYVASTAGG